MKTKVWIASIILLALSGSAMAGYQRARDGRTRVWNSAPEPNKSLEWSGARDEKSYATGQGTLNVYVSPRGFLTGSGLPGFRKYKLTNSYTGTMVRGKFEGVVTEVDATGKTFHGNFVDGNKSPGWTDGPAPKAKAARENAASKAASKPSFRSNVSVSPTPSPEKQSSAPERPSATPEPSPSVAKSPASGNSLNSLTNPPSSLRLQKGESPTPSPSP